MNSRILWLQASEIFERISELETTRAEVLKLSYEMPQYSRTVMYITTNNLDPQIKDLHRVLRDQLTT